MATRQVMYRVEDVEGKIDSTHLYLVDAQARVTVILMAAGDVKAFASEYTSQLENNPFQPDTWRVTGERTQQVMYIREVAVG